MKLRPCAGRRRASFVESACTGANSIDSAPHGPYSPHKARGATYGSYLHLEYYLVSDVSGNAAKTDAHLVNHLDIVRWQRHHLVARSHRRRPAEWKPTDRISAGDAAARRVQQDAAGRQHRQRLSPKRVRRRDQKCRAVGRFTSAAAGSGVRHYRKLNRAGPRILLNQRAFD